MRTKDANAAKSALDSWFIANHKPELTEDLPLTRCLIEYYDTHGKFLKRHDAERRNLKYWMDFFGDTPVMNIRATKQREFIRHLISKDFAKATINGIFKTGKAAITSCHKEDMIRHIPPFIEVDRELKKHNIKKPQRWRAIEIDETALMFEHSTSERLTRYLMLLIAGASRSSAGIEINSDNIDLKSGTINLLQDGIEQTNKYRATVRLPSFIRSIYCQGNICSQSEIVPEVNNLRKREWNPTREAAGLDKTIVPYSVRHGMAKWFRQRSVDPWHVSSHLGHKGIGHSTTEIYAAFDPNYLNDVLEATEEYFKIVLSKSEQLRKYMGK